MSFNPFDAWKPVAKSSQYRHKEGSSSGPDSMYGSSVRVIVSGRAWLVTSSMSASDQPCSRAFLRNKPRR